MAGGQQGLVQAGLSVPGGDALCSLRAMCRRPRYMPGGCTTAGRTVPHQVPSCHGGAESFDQQFPKPLCRAGCRAWNSGAACQQPA